MKRFLSLFFIAWLATLGSGCRAAGEQIQILAPDVQIHLGDQEGLADPWTPLYHYQSPSTRWQGEFFVHDPGKRSWLLVMDVLQINDWGNLVQINGQRLNPGALPGRETDWASTWSRVSFAVPPSVLHAGLNVVSIQVDQFVPVFQTSDNFWEDIQFRDVVLRQRS